ncbi:MAG: hypothetical protein NWQ22_01500 [Burkholderiaceae bacterium]|nr:hypothetical protein [Burkholderiaceae bacterium]
MGIILFVSLASTSFWDRISSIRDAAQQTEQADRSAIGRIYIAKDPHLLAMLSRLDLDQEIPPQLYAAVAVILSWAYWLKGMEPGDEKIPVPRPKN